MFIDETEITAVSGRGGDGMLSFRREKYIPRGGPDGGDGGHGGSVILRAVSNKTTLQGIQFKRRYRADDGRPGGTALKRGRNGDDLVLEVPVGTMVRDAQRGQVLRDLKEAGDEVVVVPGGAGGKGNKHFAHATNQAPRRVTDGQPGEERTLRLELRLVADVGLVGSPNAGKSTFLARVSAARPKIADYPFTTLAPVIGIVDPDDRALVIADIPGLVEGAHEGHGLGDRFLRHIQRTRVLLHLVDACQGPEAAVEDWRAIRGELEKSDLELADRPWVLAISRCDTVDDAGARAVQEAVSAAAGRPAHLLSSHSGLGVQVVLDALSDIVAPTRQPQEERPRRVPPHLRDDGPDVDAPAD